MMPSSKSNKKIIIISCIAVIIMFGFCFAMVPLYNLLCKVTGTATSITPELRTALNDKAIADQTVDLSRTITVQFVTINHLNLPWVFYPEEKSVKVHPGENVKVYFVAENKTDRDMTVQAIPNMTPTNAIQHFHKQVCFCFTQQSLQAHERKRMVLLFKIDRQVPENMHVMTLAYTLFDQTGMKK